jgi:hypothetical protein
MEVTKWLKPSISVSRIGGSASVQAATQSEIANPEKSLTATIISPFPREGSRTFRYAPLSTGLDLVRKCLGQHEIATVQTITLGADKAYDAEDFVNELRSMKVTPHVAQNTSGRSSAIDGRTTRHSGYAVSQRIRKRIEEAFGWIKTVAGQRKTRFRGRDRVGWAFAFAAAAYDLVRLPKLMAQVG